MYKNELVKEISEEADITIASAEKILNSLLEVINKSLSAKTKIVIKGFGTFDIKYRPEREGRNPATGETLKIPASIVPVFKSSKTLRDNINVPFGD